MIEPNSFDCACLADPQVRQQLIFPDNVYIEIGISFDQFHIGKYSENSDRFIFQNILKYTKTHIPLHLQNGLPIYPIDDNIFFIKIPRIELLPFKKELKPCLYYEFLCNKDELSFEDFDAKVKAFISKILEKRININFTPEGEPGILFFSDFPKIIPKRPLDSIWVPQKTKDLVISQMKRFLSDEEKSFCRTHGIPYKKTYLFTGLPGTGKSSFVKALASYFNLNICYIDLGNSGSIAMKISSAPPESIILIEDIDTMFESMGGSECPQAKMSISSFINALDGMESSDGNIVILTCNDTKILDMPSIRRGRIDHIVSFEKMTKECIYGMIESFFQDANKEKIKIIANNIHSKNVIPSDLQYYILEYRDSFVEFERNIISKFQSSAQFFSAAHDHNRSITQSYQRPGGMPGYM